MAHIEVGDRFTMSVREYRRWWQFWKPRWRDVTRIYTVTVSLPGVTLGKEAAR